MRWEKDSFGWWDYEYGELLVAAYKQISADTWEVLWWRLDNEYLPTTNYTEEQVREHIKLKYKLLKGD